MDFIDLSEYEIECNGISLIYECNGNSNCTETLILRDFLSPLNTNFHIWNPCNKLQNVHFVCSIKSFNACRRFASQLFIRNTCLVIFSWRFVYFINIMLLGKLHFRVIFWINITNLRQYLFSSFLHLTRWNISIIGT